MTSAGNCKYSINIFHILTLSNRKSYAWAFEIHFGIKKSNAYRQLWSYLDNHLAHDVLRFPGPYHNHCGKSYHNRMPHSINCCVMWAFYRDIKFGFRMRREWRVLFSPLRTWQETASWRASRHVCHARAMTLTRARGKTFPAFPAQAQPAFLCIWQETHCGFEQIHELSHADYKRHPGRYHASALYFPFRTEPSILWLLREISWISPKCMYRLFSSYLHL